MIPNTPHEEHHWRDLRPATLLHIARSTCLPSERKQIRGGHVLQNLRQATVLMIPWSMVLVIKYSKVEVIHHKALLGVWFYKLKLNHNPGVMVEFSIGERRRRYWLQMARWLEEGRRDCWLKGTRWLSQYSHAVFDTTLRSVISVSPYSLFSHLLSVTVHLTWRSSQLWHTK